MGRHDGGKQAVRPWLVALVLVGVLAALGLGWWWWTLRGTGDPVAADPVSAYGSIVTSTDCATPGAVSTVRFSTAAGPVTAPLSACGYAPDQSVLVEYLRSDPQQVRLAGTGTDGSTVLRRLLPVGVLVFGLIGGGALVVLATQPGGRRRAGDSRNDRAETTGGPVTTAVEVPAGSWLLPADDREAREAEDRTATDLLPTGAEPATDEPARRS